MWTYYKQIYPHGEWCLFRQDDQRCQEIFHRQNGWTASNELFLRQSKGQVDVDDIVGEEEALATIQSIGGSASKT
jgi:hypothetical protein